MAFWTIDLMALDGASTPHSAAPFKTARVTWAADGTGALEVTLSKAQAESGWWRAGQFRVAVRDGAGTRRYQGWLERLERGGDTSEVKGGGKVYRAASRGLAAILERRYIHGDFSQVAAVATTAATAILAHIDAQTDDKTNFTVGTITGVAPSVTRYFCDGDEALAAINELSTYFAWEIDANGAFNAWVGGRGTDRSGTYTISDASTHDWEVSEDTTEMSTYVTGLGDSDDSTPCGPPLVVDFNALRTTYGRLESVLTDVTNSLGEMTDKTTEELRASQAARYSLRTTWIEGYRAPWTFGTVWIGDLVNADLGAAFGGVVKVKCTSITATLDPGKREFIETTWEAA
jgi:hypothetical protein